MVVTHRFISGRPGNIFIVLLAFLLTSGFCFDLFEQTEQTIGTLQINFHKTFPNIAQFFANLLPNGTTDDHATDETGEKVVEPRANVNLIV